MPFGTIEKTTWIAHISKPTCLLRHIHNPYEPALETNLERRFRTVQAAHSAMQRSVGVSHRTAQEHYK